VAEAAQSVGEALAAVLDAVAVAQPVPPAPLWMATVEASLPLRPLPRVEACRRTLQECEEKLATAEAEGVEETALFYLRDDVLCARDLLDRAQSGISYGLPFQASALGIGDGWGLAALTHEVFAEYQLRLDGVSPWAHTMVTAYTNGCESYLPTDAALTEGGYEGASYPVPGAAWRYPYRVTLAPGCEDQVRSALREVAQQAAG
jgi:hypothetical protein